MAEIRHVLFLSEEGGTMRLGVKVTADGGLGEPRGSLRSGQLKAAGAPWGPSPSAAERHGLWAETLLTFPAPPRACL